LTASAGVSAWVEFTLLRRALNRRIGQTGLPASLVAKLWISAAVAAAAGWGVKLAIGPHHPIVSAIPILVAYGLVYFGVTFLLRVEECTRTLRRFIPSSP
jgi:putative peptidoglycan lipid II flippase